MPNFVEIAQNAAEIQDGGRPSVPVPRPNMRHRAKFREDQYNRSGDMAVYNFSRWRPSTILDLLYACLDHPRSVFWWSLSLCKIWFESVQ